MKHGLEPSLQNMFVLQLYWSQEGMNALGYLVAPCNPCWLLCISQSHSNAVIDPSCIGEEEEEEAIQPAKAYEDESVMISGPQ